MEQEKVATIYPENAIDITILALGNTEPKEHPVVTFQRIARGEPMIVNQFSVDSEELRTRHGEFKLVGGAYAWFYNGKEVSLSFLCQKFPRYREYFLSHTDFFIQESYRDMEILPRSEADKTFIREQLESLAKDLETAKTEIEL